MSHVSFADISDVVNASVGSSTLMSNDIIVTEDELSESIALHLPVAYDETSIQIAICNYNYKFAEFPYSILEEFTIVNKVTGMIHSEIVRMLHSV